MTPNATSASQALAQIEAWRRPLFDRLPKGPEESRALRRSISALLADLFQALVVRQAPEVVLEVGAHEATMSIAMKRALESARIVAFEANPYVFEHQHRRFRRLGIEYVHACVAESEGPKRFLVPMDGERRRLRMGSMLVHRNSAEFTESEVEGVTLDGFLGDQAAAPNAIWLDVEGATGAVLDGAPVTLSSCVALFAELEVEQRWAGQRLESDIAAQLARHGLVPVVSDIQAPWQFNVLFLRADAIAAASADCEAYRAAAEALIDASLKTETPGP